MRACAIAILMVFCGASATPGQSPFGDALVQRGSDGWRYLHFDLPVSATGFEVDYALEASNFYESWTTTDFPEPDVTVEIDGTDHTVSWMDGATPMGFGAPPGFYSTRLEEPPRDSQHTFFARKTFSFDHNYAGRLGLELRAETGAAVYFVGRYEPRRFRRQR
jgi:hypothetical protein